MNFENEISQMKMPHQNMGQLQPGMELSGYYVLQSASIRNTAAGKTFFSGSISDRTGSAAVIMWDYSGPVSALDEGKPVYISGLASEYKGALQITAHELRLTRADDEQMDLEALVPVAPISAEEMYSRIAQLTASIRDRDYRGVAEAFLHRHGEALRNIPAAKSVHHSFLHGLLMHTGNMLKTADFLAELYRDTVNRDLLLTGTLLHDFSKREEFTFSALGLVSGYSVKGQLLGHLVMVSQEAGEIGRELGLPEEKIVLLQHMLLAHHGKPEYGAAVIPMCAESELLSLIDMLDSRMEIYRENLEQTPMGQFSGRVFALDGHRVYHHYTPEEQ